jgi:hypothetical protein
VPAKTNSLEGNAVCLERSSHGICAEAGAEFEGLIELANQGNRESRHQSM